MVLSGVSLLLVVSSLLMLWARSIVTSIRILALQSTFLGIAGLLLAFGSRAADLYIMALLTLAIKAAIIPALLYATMRKIGVERPAQAYLTREASLLVAVGLIVFSYAITGKLAAVLSWAEYQYLPSAVAMLLIGLFIMVTHKKLIMQGIGLIVMENGLFLFALATALGMPFMVDLGVFLDVLISVILISTLSYRTDQRFKSINTDWLSSLKG